MLHLHSLEYCKSQGTSVLGSLKVKFMISLVYWQLGIKELTVLV